MRLLGAVENMSGFVCPHCGETHDVFPRVAPERSLWADGVERLATIPLDPVVRAAERRAAGVRRARDDGRAPARATDGKKQCHCRRRVSMGSAYALPVPARHSLRLPVGHILNGLGLRSAVVASALAIP